MLVFIVFSHYYPSYSGTTDKFHRVVVAGAFLSLAVIGPALNSHIANFAGEYQGTVMGLNSASTSRGKVVGPLWGGTIRDLNIEYSFYSGAATLLFGLFISLIGLRKKVEEIPAEAGKNRVVGSHHS
jgi:predicted MFS family arabinose efflux permease